MPDWHRLVTERLAHLKLTPDVRREVVAEIAAHLEEHCVELRQSGVTDPEAQTLAQVSDWTALCRRIRRAKEDRMGFVRKVVMPGVTAILASQAVLQLCVYLLVTPELCGPDTPCIRVNAEIPAYFVWLATLPLIGALAAGLARRIDARPLQRLLAAVAPALYLGAQILVASVLDAFYWRIPIFWFVIPAVACAIGAWPFLGNRRNPFGRREVATTHRDDSQDESKMGSVTLRQHRLA